MKISTETATWLKRIADGDAVTDIGQLPDETRRVLKRMTKSGQLRQVVDVTFPIRKKAWIGSGLQIGEWPVNIIAA